MGTLDRFSPWFPNNKIAGVGAHLEAATGRWGDRWCRWCAHICRIAQYLHGNQACVIAATMDCKTSFTVKVGTIFHHTHMPLPVRGSLDRSC